MARPRTRPGLVRPLGPAAFGAADSRTPERVHQAREDRNGLRRVSRFDDLVTGHPQVFCYRAADKRLVFDNQDPNRRNVTECCFHGGSSPFRLQRNASQGHLFKLRKILVKLSFVNR